MAPARRSNLHGHIIREDDDRDSFETAASEMQFTGKASTMANVQRDHRSSSRRVMSSPIDETAAIHHAIRFDEMSKENAESPLVHRRCDNSCSSNKMLCSPAKRNGETADSSSRTVLADRLAAVELKNDERWHDLMQRMAALEENNELRSMEMLKRLQQFDVFVRFQLWNMEDTDLSALRDGLAEIKDTVAQLARTDAFIRQFTELKLENAQLRSQLRVKSASADDSAK